MMLFSKKIKPWAIMLFSLLLCCNLASAQTSAQTKAAPDAIKVETLLLEGKTLESKDFQLSSLKGKVSLVMFWSTDCPVCRDKMPELRENVKGWADKPFELVLVSVDKNMKDVDDYFKYLSQIFPSKQRITHLWSGGANYKDNIGAKQMQLKQLPITYLINKEGKVAAVYNGRIPAEIWDEIAELL
jgi:cytochrome oxidase Cu insertion factor (SCO1/SenC/PrrC family)